LPFLPVWPKLATGNPLSRGTLMRKRLAAAVLAVALTGAPALAADFETGERYVPDFLSCLEMARAEGRLIIEISALHPVVKDDERGEAAAHEEELKQDKQSVHRERRRVKCI
jgi:hypothetical protein